MPSLTVVAATDTEPRITPKIGFAANYANYANVLGDEDSGGPDVRVGYTRQLYRKRKPELFRKILSNCRNLRNPRPFYFGDIGGK